MILETTSIHVDGDYEIEYYIDIDRYCFIDAVRVKGVNITDVVSEGWLKYWEMEINARNWSEE